MRLNSTTRELICKVVYTGPGMAGKTTNLAHLQRVAPPEAVGEMVSIDTTSERTLHFDLLPLDLGEVRGYRVRFEFFTVPGQTYYAATRRMVLEGADGIVFVADSRREAMDENIESLNDLYSNLRYHHIDPDTIPLVFQFNKQDLSEAIPTEQLGPLLNHSAKPAFAASAKSGKGVVETMRAVAKLVVEGIRDFESIPEETEATLTNAKAIDEPEEQDLTDTGSSSLVHPESWLLTCCHCQNILEVPAAKRGDLFTCGACSNRFVVQDPERGVTAPLPKTKPGTAALPEPVRKKMGSKPLPSPSAKGASSPKKSAGGTGSRPQPQVASTQRPSSAGDDLGVTGAKVLSVLSQDALAVHYRLRLPDGQTCRAMVPHEEIVGSNSFALALEPSLRLLQRQSVPRVPNFLTEFKGNHGPVLCFSDTPETESLGGVLARLRLLAPRQAFQLAAAIADVCDRAATAGVLHGWLRPDVIMVNQQQQVSVFGFGQPNMHGYLLDEALTNSPAAEHFVAPELLVSPNEWSPQGDMFLLGAVLYRLVTGQPLLTGYSGRQALEAFVSGSGAHPRANAPQINQGQETVIRRLTAVDPVTRYANWSEARTALLAVLRSAAPERNRRSGNQTGGRTGRSAANNSRSQGARPNTTRQGAPGRTGQHGRSATQRHGGSNAKRQSSSVLLPVLLVVLIIAVVVAVVMSQSGAKESANNPPPLATDAPRDSTAQTSDQSALDQASVAVAAVEKDPQNSQLRQRAEELIGQLPIYQSAQAKSLRLRLKDSLVTVTPASAEDAQEPNSFSLAFHRELPASLRAQVQAMLREERFRQARDTVVAELDLEVQQAPREATVALIEGQHLLARESLESRLAAMPASERQATLQQAINTWDMPTDNAWATMALERLNATTSE